MTAADITPPLSFKEEFLEKSKPRSDFDYYVPSLIILAVIMVLFTAAAAIIRENDKQTIRRLRISNLTGFEFLAGISLVQLIITEISVLLAYATVLGLGYRPAGSTTDVLIIGFNPDLLYHRAMVVQPACELLSNLIIESFIQ